MRGLTALLAAPMLAVALAAPAPAQVGKQLPEVELEDFGNTAAKDFDDFRGRTVLIEFFAYWWGPCASSVPHLNELHSEFESRGLTIIGVTDESSSQTEPWIEKHEAAYPFAYYSGSDLKNFAGVRGIPHAILVDPTGQVVWAGHPGGLRASTVEAHLEGSLPMPLFEFPKAAKKVRKALEKDSLQTALEEARAIEAEGVEQSARIRAAVEGMIAGRVAQVKRAHERGDFLTVVERGAPLVEALDELPEAAEVRTLVDAVEDDDDAQAVVAVQRKLRDIREDAAELRKKREADKLIGRLEGLIEDVPGTYAATQAKELLDAIRKQRVGLR